MMPEETPVTFEDGLLHLGREFVVKDMGLVAIAFGPDIMTPVAVGFVMEDKFFEIAVAKMVYQKRDSAVFASAIQGVAFSYEGSVFDDDGAVSGRVVDYLVFPEYVDDWHGSAGRIFQADDESVFLHQNMTGVEGWPEWWT